MDPKIATDDCHYFCTVSRRLRRRGPGGVRRPPWREDEVSIRLLDVDYAQDYFPDALPRGRYFGFSIKPDKSGIYYSAFRRRRGLSHRTTTPMGSPASADQEIFGKGYGPTQNVGGCATQNGRWLVIAVSEGVPAKRTELYFQDLAAKGPLQHPAQRGCGFRLPKMAATGCS